MTLTAEAPDRLWTRDFVLAALVNAFWGMVFYVLLTSMAVYAVQRFQASAALAGMAASMFVIGALVVRVFAGKLLSVVGRRPTLLASLVVSVAACLAYLAADSLPGLLVIRFLHGVAFGAGSTAVVASVQTMIPASRRSEGTGMFGLSTTLSTAIGPFLAAALSTSPAGFSAVFWACVVISIVGFGIAWFVRLPEPPRHADEDPWWRLRATDVLDRPTLPIASVVLIVGASYSGIVAFLASYAQSMGIGDTVGAFFIVYALAMVVSRFFAGRIQDRLGDNAVMVPTLTLFSGAFLLLAFAPVWWGVLGAAVLAGLGFGTVVPAAQTIAVRLSPISRVGHVTSTYFLMLDAGVGLGPIALGLLVPSLGFSGVYALSAVVVLASVGYYLLVHGRRHGGRPGERPAAEGEVAPAAPVGRRRVLVGIDGSADGLRAALYAMRSARATDRDVWLVSVVEEGDGAVNWGTYFPAAQLQQRAQQAVDDARRTLAAEGFPGNRVTSDLRSGRPAEVLVKLSQQADLMVLGRRSVHGLERMFVGSTTVTVAAASGCPVVVISAASTPQETGRLGVLAVAVGTGDQYTAALDWTFREADKRAAGVRVVHITPPWPGPAGVPVTEDGTPMAPGREPADVALDTSVDATLAGCRATFPHVPVVVELSRDSVIDHLIDVSKTVDLLVLGTHSTGATGLALGGVVRGVMAHSHSPVVLTPLP